MLDLRCSEFRAMGSACRVVARGVSAKDVDDCVRLIAQLERLWSRFLPSSEVSAVNNNSGHITLVSPKTATLFEHAEAARRATLGRFNPLMLAQLQTLGYSTPWVEGSPLEVSGDVGPGSTSAIEVDAGTGGVRIPAGTCFDPGGIGKGLTADMATHFLEVRGSTTTSVEMGGDIRVSGAPWYGPAWRIGVLNPIDELSEIAAFTPSQGAVATSSTLGRRWKAHGETFHHLLDPMTGYPSQTDLISATSCATSAWWAEVVAKVALMAGSSGCNDVFQELNAPGIAVIADGMVVRGSHYLEMAGAS